MKKSDELAKIKKLYGESFMHLCRELFPTILEREGALLNLLLSTFEPNSRCIGEDIRKNGLELQFRNFIMNKIIDNKLEIGNIDCESLESKTPYELLDEARL